MIGIWHRSNLVTYAGVLVAALGVSLCLVSPVWAVLCLILAGVADLLDGTYARRFTRDERTRAYGVQLDSLADMVGFVVLPLAILLRLGPAWWVVAVAAAAYAVAAVTRLAYFNIATDGTPGRYHGLPVTYAALVLPVVWLGLTLAGGGQAWGWAAALVALAVAYVVDVPVPKPRGRATIGLLVLAVVLVAAVVAVGVAP